MDRVGYGSGDIVAVRRNPEPNEGDVVIARIWQDVTLKCFHRAGRHRIDKQNMFTCCSTLFEYVMPRRTYRALCARIVRLNRSTRAVPASPRSGSPSTADLSRR